MFCVTVSVDESEIDSYIHQPFGWAKREKLVHGEISGKRYTRETFLAAKCASRILTLFCYRGTCITDFLIFGLRSF